MNKEYTHTYTYRFYGDDGMLKIDDVMKMLRYGLKTVGGLEVESIQEHSQALEYRLAGGSHVSIRFLTGGSGPDFRPELKIELENSADEMKPGRTAIPEASPEAEPAMEVTISVTGENDEAVAAVEVRIRKDLESIIYMDHGMGNCCE